jgi:cardiolipin synthase
VSEQSTRQGPSLLRQAFNVPNTLSWLRLAGVPLFLWLLLGPRADGWALAVLVVSALTDWLDGKLARWLDQMSRLGALLDPAADRLYIIATLVAFLIRDIVPWWVVAPLVLRELVVGACVLLLRGNGFAPPEVSYIGKGATFVLMYAFPFLLLTQGGSAVAAVARPIAYAFLTWGGVLYLWSGALYVMQSLRAPRAAAAGGDAGARGRVEDWPADGTAHRAGEGAREGEGVSTPEELRYTEEHEWVGVRDGGSVRVGITEYAQDQLGDVVFVELPEVGKLVVAGDAFGEVESTKSVSELFAPVDGEIVAVNDAVAESPELINSDPYGEGWLIEIRLDEAGSLEGLLEAEAYQAIISG